MKRFKLRFASKQKSSKNEIPVAITLDQARKDPAMVKEMYGQLNEAFITTGTKTEYKAGIRINGKQHCISGTYQEWSVFFGMNI